MATRRTRTCPRRCGASPGRTSSARSCTPPASSACRYRTLAGGIIGLHVGEVPKRARSMRSPCSQATACAAISRASKSCCARPSPGATGPPPSAAQGTLAAGGKRLRPAALLSVRGRARRRRPRAGRGRRRARALRDARPRRRARPGAAAPRPAHDLGDGRPRARRRHGRLPLRAGLRAPGGDDDAARRRRAGRLHARPRPGRGAADAAGPRRADDARAVPRALRPQDRDAVRHRLRPRRSPRRRAASPRCRCCGGTATTSASRSRSRTTCSTAPGRWSRPASRSAPTCSTAPRRCRCCTPRASTRRSAHAIGERPAPDEVLGLLARVAESGAITEARAVAHDYARRAEAALDELDEHLDTRPLRAVVRGVVDREA